MKFGFRKPNFKKRIKARTTGKIKRKIKKTINPLYNKKGIGWLKNPKKALYNKTYNKTTFGVDDMIKPLKKVEEKKPIKINNKKEANFMAEQWFKIVVESANIVNTTTNPNVFFERYELLLEKLELLSSIEHMVKFKGKKPSQNLQEILTKKELTINDFINRYYNVVDTKLKKLSTIKAKENNIDNFLNNLEYYKEKMTQSNIEYYIQLYGKLKKYI